MKFPFLVTCQPCPAGSRELSRSERRERKMPKGRFGERCTGCFYSELTNLQNYKFQVILSQITLSILGRFGERDRGSFPLILHQTLVPEFRWYWEYISVPQIRRPALSHPIIIIIFCHDTSFPTY